MTNTLLNWPFQASFSFNFVLIVGIEGDHADHLTTTTALRSALWCLVMSYLVDKWIERSHPVPEHHSLNLSTSEAAQLNEQ